MEITIDEIKEGNILIVKYLGWVYNPETSIHFPMGTWHDSRGLGHCEDRGLKFHVSWDWLFDVIDKINGLGKGHNLTIHKTYLSLSVEGSSKFHKSFKFAYSEYITPEQSGKEAAFKLIVRFIKWENEIITENETV